MTDPLNNFPADQLEPIVDQIVAAVIDDNPTSMLDAITAAQQVGGHGWHTSLIFALAARAATTIDPDDKLTSAEIFVTDYTAMRKAGLKHEQIASTMGVSMDTLNKRIDRAGCRILEDDERHVVEALGRLITAGRTFTIDDLPFGIDRRHVVRAVNAACREGRIIEAGRTQGMARNGSVVRWVPARRVEAALQVAS